MSLELLVQACVGPSDFKKYSQTPVLVNFTGGYGENKKLGEKFDDWSIWYTSVMKLPVNVKLRRGIAAYIPWLNNNTAQGLYPNVYLPRKVFENLRKENPNPKFIAVLAHEQKHIERQKEVGPFKWGMKYSFCPSFRFNEELIATKAQMAVYKKFKKDFDIKKSARYLSGWLYLWPMSYEAAKRKLEKMWFDFAQDLRGEI